jgi:phosphoenolpyruvate-protein kinase (PTS system EI component)
MMAETLLAGHPAAPGVAVGRAWRRPEQDRATHVLPAADRAAEQARARDALEQAGAELNELADRLPGEEGEIVRAGVLMASDPALLGSIDEAVMERGAPASAAILQATDAYADAIAALGDEVLAARADDVRSLGRRAAAHASTEADGGAVPSDEPVIVVDRDLGPADVAELPSAVVGVALAGSAPTAHAAIVARSLGLPLVTGIGPEVLAIADGTQIVLDGDTGSLVVEPEPESARAAAAEMRARQRAVARDDAERELPARTRDGHTVTVFVNVAGTVEVQAGLRAGAEGIGLLRTELAFMEAAAWPTESEHLSMLTPILAAVGSRPAVVRVLDFGADKAPAFLSHTELRGITLLLGEPDALAAQLRAILRAARGRDVRILLPLVDDPEQVAAVRDLLADNAQGLDDDGLPPVGAMVETPRAAGAARALAAASDFLSIGTNDLTAATLGVDRFSGGAKRTSDPRVLTHIAASVDGAHAAGRRIEVCGEAASDPMLLPLLVGLGVDELSVGAARVGVVRRWVRLLSHQHVQRLGAEALTMDSAEQVEELLAPLVRVLHSAEVQDAVDERLDGGAGIVTLGA